MTDYQEKEREIRRQLGAEEITAPSSEISGRELLHRIVQEPTALEAMTAEELLRSAEQHGPDAVAWLKANLP